MMMKKIFPTVDIDVWWRAMELKMLEAVVYKDAKMEPVVAASIAPWIPPSCRGKVVNTEHMKSAKNSKANCSATPTGCPKTLAELIRIQSLRPTVTFSTQSAGSSLLGWHSLQANHHKGINKCMTLYNNIHCTLYTW
jgi:hypothetical protein